MRRDPSANANSSANVAPRSNFARIKIYKPEPHKTSLRPELRNKKGVAGRSMRSITNETFSNKTERKQQRPTPITICLKKIKACGVVCLRLPPVRQPLLLAPNFSRIKIYKADLPKTITNGKSEPQSYRGDKLTEVSETANAAMDRQREGRTSNSNSDFGCS